MRQEQLNPAQLLKIPVVVRNALRRINHHLYMAEMDISLEFSIFEYGSDDFKVFRDKAVNKAMAAGLIDHDRVLNGRPLMRDEVKRNG